MEEKEDRRRKRKYEDREDKEKRRKREDFGLMAER
jgi:hypothetical protein